MKKNSVNKYQMAYCALLGTSMFAMGCNSLGFGNQNAVAQEHNEKFKIDNYEVTVEANEKEDFPSLAAVNSQAPVLTEEKKRIEAARGLASTYILQQEDSIHKIDVKPVWDDEGKNVHLEVRFYTKSDKEHACKLQAADANDFSITARVKSGHIWSQVGGKVFESEAIADGADHIKLVRRNHGLQLVATPSAKAAGTELFPNSDAELWMQIHKATAANAAKGNSEGEDTILIQITPEQRKAIMKPGKKEKEKKKGKNKDKK